jgi:tripartite-type tricarboxylate transporter receptor subunit TctC
MKKIKALAALFGMVLTMTVSAQTTQFIVHHAPGGPADILARLTTSYIKNKNYVIINRPGGQGILAISQLRNSKSIMMANISQIFVTNSLIFGDKLSYNPSVDLEIIAVVGAMPQVLVCHSSKNIKSIQDLVKSKFLNFGVAGVGSSEHLATELLLGKTSRNHQIVPYSNGGGSSLQDLLAGNVDCMFANYPLIKPMIDQNIFNPIFSSHELNLSVPTWKELFGENFPLNSELGIVVDRKMESSLKTQIKNDVNYVMKSSDYISSMKQIGFFPIAGTDIHTVKKSYDTQQQLKNFIVQNNINLQD